MHKFVRDHSMLEELASCPQSVFRSLADLVFFWFWVSHLCKLLFHICFPGDIVIFSFIRYVCVEVYCNVLYCIVQYGTVLHVVYSTVPYCTVLYNTVNYSNVLYSTDCRYDYVSSFHSCYLGLFFSVCKAFLRFNCFLENDNSNQISK